MNTIRKVYANNILFSFLILILFNSCESSNYDENFSNGKLLFASKSYEKAIDSFTEAINCKQTQEAYKLRALAYYNLKKYDNANKDIEKAFEKSTYEDKELFLLKGLIYDYKKDKFNALENYSKALLIDSNYIEALLLRGILEAGSFHAYGESYLDFTRVNTIDSNVVDSKKFIQKLIDSDFIYFEKYHE